MGKKTIKCKWVFKTQRNEIDGVRYKARLVVKGCSQRSGIDYAETYSPAVRYTSIRRLVALAAKYEMALYGLKQASLYWNLKLDQELTNFGLIRSKTNPCVYYKNDNPLRVYAAIYVDDLLVFTSDAKMKKNIKDYLIAKSKTKDLGAVKFCLVMHIERGENHININQKDYIEKIFTKFGMADCKPIATPLDPNTKLKKLTSEDEEEEVQSVPYQEEIGSLINAAQTTRPDISHVVNYFSKFNNNPGKAHWSAVKRVFRYLQGTKAWSLKFSNEGNKDFLGFSDAYWGADEDER